MPVIPRVAAVHDISGLGRCSLTVALPILSAMGIQCCPVPTAVLSAQTAYEGFTFRDLGSEIVPTARHWKAVNAEISAVYTGFLGSESQIDQIKSLIETLSPPMVFVDPVMGDNGMAYKTYTPEMCVKMAELVERADIITPNSTEAAILLGERFEDAPNDPEGIRAWMERLCGLGPRMVVMTGIILDSHTIGVAGLDKGTFTLTRFERIGDSYHGAGDIFSSVLLGGLLQGNSLPAAIHRAGSFVREAIGNTLKLGAPLIEGLVYEQVIYRLCEKIT